MATQIIAVRVTGGETVRHIAHVVWRNDQTGKLGSLSRQGLADWMLLHPNAIVFTRNRLRKISLVKALRVASASYIYSLQPKDTVDELLLLPRF